MVPPSDTALLLPIDEFRRRAAKADIEYGCLKRTPVDCFLCELTLNLKRQNGKWRGLMRLKAERPLLSEIPSIASICFFSILSALIVFSVALLLQWFIYNDWMHRNGQLRLVGSALASAWTFAFVYHRQVGLREKKVEMLRRSRESSG